ncbi:MAG: hypothetical protein WAX89_02190 [Alphaproteobacteria bacterium]
MKRIDKYTFYTLLGHILYLATAIPLGLAFYSIKNTWGWNILSRGGFHAMQTCMGQQLQKAQQQYLP